MSETPTIAEITRDFGEVYIAVKGTKTEDGWEKLLKDAQRQFFDAATRELEKETLARKTVKMPKGEDAPAWVTTRYPGWRLVEESGSKAIIEEDPKFKNFEFVNPEDGMVYRRSQAANSHKPPLLDIERLQEEDPDLYEAVTEWDSSVYDLARLALQWASLEDVNNDTVQNFLTEAQVPRVVKDSSAWTPKQAAALQKYIIPGGITVRLTPPRPATEEELETGQVMS